MFLKRGLAKGYLQRGPKTGFVWISETGRSKGVPKRGFVWVSEGRSKGVLNGVLYGFLKRGVLKGPKTGFVGLLKLGFGMNFQNGDATLETGHSKGIPKRGFVWDFETAKGLFEMGF